METFTAKKEGRIYTHRGTVVYFEGQKRMVDGKVCDGSSKCPAHVYRDGKIWRRGDCKYDAKTGNEIGENSMWCGRLMVESLQELKAPAFVL